MIIFHFLRRSSCTHEQFLSFALQKFLYARTVPFVCFAKVPLRTNSSFTHKQFLYAQIVPFICFAEVFAEVESMKFRAARSLTHEY
ncbi:hypothetical protein JI435_308480 [Parastagonospora nodorum SN15]|uniref:Uncharacterized protein n=1 Tax=Phaeosphaeria nodorum (strain SN15 / ATCC MYA-4574 / FGSC 10173) TaxID=321614 RepID=A0A7U2IBW2_PHANO|nr:hypothetical protein JI435_308480 [Parastagonospora nodorum SN15]